MKINKIELLGIMAILVLVVFASGCTSSTGDSNSSNTQTDSSNNTNTGESSSTATGIHVKVSYPGSWSGNYIGRGSDKASDQKIVEGSGDKTFEIGDTARTVTAVFKKTDGGTGTLTIQIIKDGQVIETNSSSEVDAFLSLQHRFDS